MSGKAAQGLTVPRILVADDNTNIQKMVALALQERGIEVTSVGNGEAAVRRLPDLNPDLILADIFMPVRNGYEVCEWVKKESKFSHIPVILLVGAFDPLDEKEARRVGADGILKKPFIPPDPLIAMVTSTLEKNPKLAAEMAQAREAKEAKAAAPPAPPVITHEIPKKIELQPVTEFPEPSTDDASLAYGFGAGRRDVEDDGHDETAAARAPKSDFDKRSEEDFDGASTTSDWRRNAMSFEVPEEASRQPAFSTEDETEPAPASHAFSAASHTIPAPPAIDSPEINVPTVIEASAIEMKPLELEPAVSEEQLQSFHSAVETGEHPGEGESEWASDEPDHVAGVQADSVIAAPEVAASPATETGTNEEAPISHISVQASRDTSKPSHWMDLMASASGQPQSDWLSLINAQSNGGSDTQSTVTSMPAVPATAELNSISHKTEELPVSDTPSELPSLQDSVKEAAQDSDGLPSYGSAVAETGAAAEKSEEEEDWFFADEPAGEIGSQCAELSAAKAADGISQSQEPAPTAESRSGVPSQKDSQISSASEEAGSGEFEATVAEPVAVSSPQEKEVDFFDEPSTEPVASSEPDLIEPPAVHVTPEPLLVDEASQKPSAAYGHADQDIPPTYEFLPQAEDKAAEMPASSEPVSAEADNAAEAQSSSSELEVSLRESEPASTDERSVVTNAETAGPETSTAADDDHKSEVATSFGLNEAARKFIRPTAREQLAHIPFLNPPPDFDANSEAKPADLNPAAEAQAVETVVQRILDKIEPQLHNLLAQNLKPLIENLVHAELEKKE